jgi:DNA-binding PadR family transcriptional regulator
MRYGLRSLWNHDHDHHHGDRRHMRGHGRHRGFGEFGGAGEGDGGRGLGRGRKLTAGDLQLVILALLADKPRHGYELIKELDERSGGFYSPSPGMIYPALTYLDEIGHATVEAEGTKKLYRITDTGMAHLAANRPLADSMLAQLGRIASKMDRVRRAFAGDAAGEAESDEDARRMGEELLQVRRNLRAILHEGSRAAVEEQKRIAAILRRAIDEIGAGK